MKTTGKGVISEVRVNGDWVNFKLTDRTGYKTRDGEERTVTMDFLSSSKGDTGKAIVAAGDGTVVSYEGTLERKLSKNKNTWYFALFLSKITVESEDSTPFLFTERNSNDRRAGTIRCRWNSQRLC